MTRTVRVHTSSVVASVSAYVSAVLGTENSAVNAGISAGSPIGGAAMPGGTVETKVAPVQNNVSIVAKPDATTGGSPGSTLNALPKDRDIVAAPGPGAKNGNPPAIP